MPKQRMSRTLRIQPYLSTVKEQLWQYILDHEVRSPYDLLTQMAKAFLLPYAFEAKGDIAPEKLRQVARDAVYALEAQIERIKSDFSLEPPARDGRSNDAISLGKLSSEQTFSEDEPIAELDSEDDIPQARPLSLPPGLEEH